MFIKAKDLQAEGFPASTIRQFCHMEGSPFFQKVPRGTWWTDRSKFDKWIDELSQQKETWG